MALRSDTPLIDLESKQANTPIDRVRFGTGSFKQTESVQEWKSEIPKSSKLWPRPASRSPRGGSQISGTRFRGRKDSDQAEGTARQVVGCLLKVLLKARTSFGQIGTHQSVDLLDFVDGGGSGEDDDDRRNDTDDCWRGTKIFKKKESYINTWSHRDGQGAPGGNISSYTACDKSAVP